MAPAVHAVDLIAAALPALEREPLPCAPLPGVCCVTGASVETLPRKLLLGPSFTDGALLAAPDSDRVGLPAWWALKHRWERQSHWWCDGERFERLGRAGVRARVLDLPGARPWCGYATTSWKKHGALRAPVNAPGQAVWLWETERVDVLDCGEIYARLLDMSAAGVWRSGIESLICPAHVIAKTVGVTGWLAFERWARPRYRSAAYRFCVWLLPSAAELAA